VRVVSAYLTPAVVGVIVPAAIALSTLLYKIWRNRVVLIVSQSGNNVTNRVFGADFGQIGYSMEVKIINDSSKPVTLRGFELQLLWNDLDFYWLRDPAEIGNREMKYKMPGTFIEYRRDLVINHRKFKEGVMQPGDVIGGMLLGAGCTPIPKCFPHGSEIEMMLFVYDQRGKRHRAKFAFFVDNSRSS